MIIISGSSNIPLAIAIATRLSIPYIKADIQRFNDQEFRIQIKGQLYAKDVVIVQSTSKPANDNLMELLLLADAARRAGAQHITAIIPYFGYGRQDRLSGVCEPVSANVMATMLESAGIDKIITIDLHSKRIQGFFKIEVNNLDGLHLFKPLLHGNANSIIVSPDVGGFFRAKKFSEALACPLAIINKTRESNGNCYMKEVIGNVGNRNCILIDDIIDTGATLCRAAELLMQKGALSVKACITHAVLSRNAIDLVEASAISELYLSNSIFHEMLSSKMRMIPLDEMLAAVIC